MARAHAQRVDRCRPPKDEVDHRIDHGGMGLIGRRPSQHVAVVGAGMVGLSTAWYLQEHGVDVTVVDQTGVAAGSSWGNAGWLTPSIAVPLPEPSVLRYGARAVLRPSSPVYIPPAADMQLVRFLAQFVRNCTRRRWEQAMKALIPLNNGALAAFDEMERGGVAARTDKAEPFTAAFVDQEDSRALLEELEHIEKCGQGVTYEVVDGGVAREAEPALCDRIEVAVRIRGERFIDPAAYLRSIAASFVARGGTIQTGTVVTKVGASDTGVVVGGRHFDAVVLATGAGLGPLARAFGVRRLVQAGRGYSFTAKATAMPRGPVYFPKQRVACTPLGDRLRVAGMMEFREATAPFDRRRLHALATQAATLLQGVDLDQREDEWVGARPCTADGLPLVGVTKAPRVYLAGGHGMWGMTLGPVTGKLLAEHVVTGACPSALRPLDPLR